MHQRIVRSVVMLASLVACFTQTLRAADSWDGEAVVRRVDDMIRKELQTTKATIAKRSTDEDFMRRVSLDIAGTLPSANEVTLFGLDTDPDKRAKLIDRLLASNAYSVNWARYWRDVIFMRATNARAPIANDAFLDWMSRSLQANKGWDKIATELITAEGEVRESGATALIFAHEGEPDEIAGEVSRIFLGIQIQCANCHDHPWDRWKREDFHELAAFFPRIQVRPANGDLRNFEVVSFNPSNDPRNQRGRLLDNLDRVFAFADRNRDGKLSKAEVEDTPLERPFALMINLGDKDKDGLLTKTEIKEVPPPPMNMPGRGAAEHFMPDLNNPAVPGTKVDPKFFVTSQSMKGGESDQERRTTFAKYLTSTQDEWFAKAYVNRLWAELTGQGFYTPVDDLGPDRSAVFPEVLDLLAKEFARRGHDPKWLKRTIALTETYQRAVEPRPTNVETQPFSVTPASRLRADQLYNSLITVLGVEPAGAPNGGGDGARRFARGPREQFSQLFGFDPSTPSSDVSGNVPQALFLMNSPQVNSQIRADSGTRLAGLLRRFTNDRDALNELYLLVFSREPTAEELRICETHIQKVGNRGEAFEDLMWSLLNSSEFLSRR